MFLPMSTVYSPEQYFAAKNGGNMLFGSSTNLVTLSVTTPTQIALLYNPPSATNEIYLSRTQLTQNIDGDWIRYRLIPSPSVAFNVPNSVAALGSINRGSGALLAQGKMYGLAGGLITIPNALLLPEVTIQTMARIPNYALESGSIVLGKGFGLVWVFTPAPGLALKANSVGVENVWWEKAIN